MPAASADAGRLPERLGASVFGTIHPKVFSLRPPIGTQIPDNPGVRLASLEMPIDSDPVADMPINSYVVADADPQSGVTGSMMPRASFHERFNSAYGERYASLTQDVPELVEESVPSTGAPAASPAPPPDATKHVNGRAALGQRASEPATTTPASKRRARTADLKDAKDAKDDPNSTPEIGSRTAIYDISAHTVYLPNGERLEAHSGLGNHIDDPRSVPFKNRGVTPPNVYDLALREKLFHGVRAIRLLPVDENKMHGRDGILAHSYMLGPNGQSNGCVSFSNYSKFLNAYLNGEVDRLVVVDRLANVPDNKAGTGWLQEALKKLFKLS